MWLGCPACSPAVVDYAVLRLWFWLSLQHDGVSGALFIPEIHDLLGAHADVGTVIHLTGKCSRHVEC